MALKNTELYFNYVFDIVKQAGTLIRNRIWEQKLVETKSSNIDFVTETDKQVEKLLIENLSQAFPDHKFIGEESVPNGSRCNLTDSPTWIIDPIDGTLNFVHGFPHSCISIALFINCHTEIGIIYNPILEQMFTAKRGQGAFLNGKQIYVSKCTDLSEAVVMMENGTSRDPARYEVSIRNQQMLLPLVHGIRALGSAALNMAMVALGGADAYFEFGIHIWDIAAGELIIKEAGGVVVDPSGGPIDRLSRRVLCASSSALADQLARSLEQFYPTPKD